MARITANRIIRKLSKVNNANRSHFKSPHIEGSIITQKEDLMEFWGDRRYATAAAHLTYVPLKYAANKLLSHKNKPLIMGGARYQASSSNGVYVNGTWSGTQMSHANMACGKSGGLYLTDLISKLLLKTNTPPESFKTLKKYVIDAIRMEGYVAKEPSFLNQTDSLIELRLKKVAFHYPLINMDSEASLTESLRMVGDMSIHTFTSGTLLNIGKEIVMDIKSGRLQEIRQNKIDPHSQLLDGIGSQYLIHLIEEKPELLKPPMSSECNSILNIKRDIFEDIPAIVQEVEELEAVT